MESAGGSGAEAVARDYLQVMAWWNALEITDATSTTRFRTQTDEERLQAALALVAAYLRGGATATLVLPVSLGLDDDCWRRFGDLVGGAGCVVRRREVDARAAGPAAAGRRRRAYEMTVDASAQVRRQFATAWKLSAHAMAVAKARAAPKRARRAAGDAAAAGRSRTPSPPPGPPPPTREPPSPELGTESLARDSVDVARFDVDAEPALAVPESPAPPRPPRAASPAEAAAAAGAVAARLAARAVAGGLRRARTRAAAARAAERRHPARVVARAAAAAGERGGARAPWLARLAGAGAAAAVPETLVVGARGTRRVEAAALAVGAAEPGDGRPRSARGGRGGRARAAAGRRPVALEVRWARDAAGALRSSAAALDDAALAARATAPRPEAGELRLIQAWVPPRGADSHLVVVWTARGGLASATRVAAPEVGVRRAVPLGPEPVATAWLLDALAAVADGVAAALARDAATRAPARLDLVFKLGAANALHLLYCDRVEFAAAPAAPAARAPARPARPAAAARPAAPARAPARPPSAKGPRRRPFQKRCEKFFKRQIAHPMEITVLSYLGADRDDARSGKERNIARLEREFSQKRALPTDFAAPTR